MASIQVTATDGAGAFDAYVVEPAGTAPAGAVVLIQEIFGVNDALRATAQQVADMGFIAICPDLFWRLEPGVNLTDKTEAEWQKAFDLMHRFDQAKGVEDLKATLAAARRLPRGNGRAGTMGYCLGGRLAFMMATRSDADVSVSYYGVGLEGLLDELPQVKRPLLVHIAALDKYVPPEAQAKITAATAGNPLIETHVYPDADHAFARVNGVHFHALAATIANGRSAAALAAALG
ncbi:MAG: dienelactone hydrolase family protein [Thermohalobaculum sp.]